MTERHRRVLDAARISWEDGTPVSVDSGDVYFSRADGIRESRHVFLDGNDLAERLPQAVASFCIAETGFGTGLNFLLARELFLARAPATAVLHYVSFERAPLATADREQFEHMLAARGRADLARAARDLHARLPPPLYGWHRVVLDEGRTRLSLWLGDACEGLADWRGAHAMGADAWFLDGFAPALNPDLWSADLAAGIAALSGARTTLATFSVARAVRDALGAAGFELTKVPGPPGKREMLRGRSRRRGAPARALPAAITVAGAGLAGASTARACAERGLAVRVADPRPPATGASANRHAVLHPRLPLEDSPRGPFLLAAQAFTRSWLERRPWRHAFRPREVIQFPERRRPERLGRVRARYGNLDGFLRWETIADEVRMVWPAGGTADLPELVAALLDHPAIDVDRAALPIQRAAGDPGRPLILATGAATSALLDPPLPLGHMRGQLTRLRGAARPDGPILTGRGHAVPLADGWSVGSSYQRLDAEQAAASAVPTAAEREENLERFRGWCRDLAMDGSAARAVEDWAGIRATSPDRAPLVGELAPGLWLSTAHASSGLLTCPLAAEAIAAALAGEPPVLDAQITALLAPGRLAARP